MFGCEFAYDTMSSKFKASSSHIIFAVLVFMSYFLVISGSKIKLYLKKNNNHNQLTTINELESYLKEYPHAKYFDGIGILPLGNQYLGYVGPNETTNNMLVFEKIKTQPPDIVLGSERIHFLGYQMQEYLIKNYAEVRKGVWIKSVNFGPTVDVKVKAKCLWLGII